MTSNRALLALSLVAAAVSQFAGDATFYSYTQQGHCSYGMIPGVTNFVALNDPQYSDGSSCGSCVRACRGSRCTTARVVDECPECKHGDLDFSLDAFLQIADEVEGRVKMDWEFIPCPADSSIFPNINAPVTWRIKDGSSQYWLGLQLDVPGKVNRMTINGQPGERQEYNYFIFQNPGSTQVQVEAEIDTGASVGTITQMLAVDTSGTVIEIPGSLTVNDVINGNFASSPSPFTSAIDTSQETKDFVQLGQQDIVASIQFNGDALNTPLSEPVITPPTPPTITFQIPQPAPTPLPLPPTQPQAEAQSPPLLPPPMPLQSQTPPLLPAQSAPTLIQPTPIPVSEDQNPDLNAVELETQEEMQTEDTNVTKTQNNSGGSLGSKIKLISLKDHFKGRLVTLIKTIGPVIYDVGDRAVQAFEDENQDRTFEFLIKMAEA